ncbi:MAG: hypothetical protein F7B17_01965 [Desulfurococcales archaeon]|nr:hypothetical protein [Desulfurococcales archaeon]
MGGRLLAILALITTVFIIFGQAYEVYAISPVPESLKEARVEGVAKVLVDENGTAYVREELSINSTIMSLLETSSISPLEVIEALKPNLNRTSLEGFKIDVDKAQNTIILEYSIPGFARYWGEGKWEIQLNELSTLGPPLTSTVLLREDSAALTYASRGKEGGGIEIVEIKLPNNAENVVFDSERSVITYETPVKEGLTGSKVFYMGVGGVLTFITLFVGAPLLLRIVRRESQQSRPRSYSFTEPRMPLPCNYTRYLNNALDEEIECAKDRMYQTRNSRNKRERR